MNVKTINILFDIIKAILNNRLLRIEADDEIEWDNLAKFLKFHEITGLVSGYLARMETLPESSRERFADFEVVNIYREMNQEVEVQNIISGFEKAGIDYMPLKGFVMKALYPSPEMRDMCDVDILIREKEIDRVRPIMEANGFRFHTESRHEFIYKSDITTIELHKSLVPVYNKDLFSYYGDGWKTANVKDGFLHQYEMSVEDFYIYSVVHTAKHYISGGAGIKQVVDTYILNHHPKYIKKDTAYIAGELNKIGLEKFENTLRHLCEVWFGDEAYDEVTKEMAKYILESGARGSSERADIAKIYREAEKGYAKAKIKIIIQMLFPDMISMKNRYKVLNRHPYLYPAMTVLRMFEAVFKRSSHMKENIKSIKNMDTSALNSFAKHCEKVGLKSTL